MVQGVVLRAKKVSNSVRAKGQCTVVGDPEFPLGHSSLEISWTVVVSGSQIMMSLQPKISPPNSELGSV